MCTFFQFNDFITWCEVLSVQLEPDAAEGCTGVNFYQTERNKTRAAQAWTLRHSTSLKSDSLFPGIMDTTLLDKWFQDLHQSELFVNMTFISSRIIWEAVGTVTLKNHRVHTSKCHSVIMESKYWRLHTKHFKDAGWNTQLSVSQWSLDFHTIETCFWDGFLPAFYQQTVGFLV